MYRLFIGFYLLWLLFFAVNFNLLHVCEEKKKEKNQTDINMSYARHDACSINNNQDKMRNRNVCLTVRDSDL